MVVASSKLSSVFSSVAFVVITGASAQECAELGSGFAETDGVEVGFARVGFPGGVECLLNICRIFVEYLWAHIPECNF